MFVVAEEAYGIGNGDLTVRTDKGRLVAVVYARPTPAETKAYAEVMANALNAAFSPSMTDLMVTPEQIESYLAGAENQPK